MVRNRKKWVIGGVSVVGMLLLSAILVAGLFYNGILRFNRSASRK